MASFNFNKVILGGRLTSDPELKTTPNGVSCTNFTVAVNRRFGKDGEQQADFIACTAWRNTAEFICKHFHKGSSICVVGALQVRNWTDKEGNKRYATEVAVEEANFVDSKGESTGGGNYIPDAYKAPSAPNMEALDTSDNLPF